MKIQTTVVEPGRKLVTRTFAHGHNFSLNAQANRLTNEQLANFTIRLYIQQHADQFRPQAIMQAPAQGSQALTGEILVDRVREWMVNLPPNQFLRHSIKGYLDQYFERAGGLLHSQALARRHFEARSQTLSITPLRQAPA